LFDCVCGTAEQAAEKDRFSGKNDEKRTSVAKATVHSVGVTPGMNPRPTARMSFSADCEAVPFQNRD
jgi:hypothetical protein